ncbi:MAG: DUF4180 domain-containing protein [Candidatus Latescibacter sp.]|nr:DUF4180 domain-containing protein [Candidatus Latescibacter sp.]
MELIVVERNGKHFIEGPSGKPFIQNAEDTVNVTGACFECQAYHVLLYAANLTERFFDLSSREAGLDAEAAEMRLLTF